MIPQPFWGMLYALHVLVCIKQNYVLSKYLSMPHLWNYTGYVVVQYLCMLLDVK